MKVTAAESWEEYIGMRRSFKRDTALFPMLDSEDPERDLLLIDRFRWMAASFGDDTEVLFERWIEAGDALTLERIKNADLTLQEFHCYSVNLVLVMAQTETDQSNLDYYRQLRDALRLRAARRGHPVLVLGPTFGGEVEAIDAAGGFSSLLADRAPWLGVCEERLFHDRVRFENLSPSELTRNPVNFRYVVISTWVPDPVTAVLTAYNALGESGFVCFPANNASLAGISDRAGLRRLDSLQPSVAVYFKHPGLEEYLENVHLEA